MKPKEVAKWLLLLSIATSFVSSEYYVDNEQDTLRPTELPHYKFQNIHLQKDNGRRLIYNEKPGSSYKTQPRDTGDGHGQETFNFSRIQVSRRNNLQQARSERNLGNGIQQRFDALKRNVREAYLQIPKFNARSMTLTRSPAFERYLRNVQGERKNSRQRNGRISVYVIETQPIQNTRRDQTSSRNFVSRFRAERTKFPENMRIEAQTKINFVPEIASFSLVPVIKSDTSRGRVISLPESTIRMIRLQRQRCTDGKQEGRPSFYKGRKEQMSNNSNKERNNILRDISDITPKEQLSVSRFNERLTITRKRIYPEVSFKRRFTENIARESSGLLRIKSNINQCEIHERQLNARSRSEKAKKIQSQEMVKEVRSERINIGAEKKSDEERRQDTTMRRESYRGLHETRNVLRRSDERILTRSMRDFEASVKTRDNSVRRTDINNARAMIRERMENKIAFRNRNSRELRENHIFYSQRTERNARFLSATRNTDSHSENRRSTLRMFEHVERDQNRNTEQKVLETRTRMIYGKRVERNSRHVTNSPIANNEVSRMFSKNTNDEKLLSGRKQNRLTVRERNAREYLSKRTDDEKLSVEKRRTQSTRNVREANGVNIQRFRSNRIVKHREIEDGMRNTRSLTVRNNQMMRLQMDIIGSRLEDSKRLANTRKSDSHNGNTETVQNTAKYRHINGRTEERRDLSMTERKITERRSRIIHGEKLERSSEYTNFPAARDEFIRVSSPNRNMRSVEDRKDNSITTRENERKHRSNRNVVGRMSTEKEILLSAKSSRKVNKENIPHVRIGKNVEQRKVDHMQSKRSLNDFRRFYQKRDIHELRQDERINVRSVKRTESHKITGEIVRNIRTNEKTIRPKLVEDRKQNKIIVTVRNGVQSNKYNIDRVNSRKDISRALFMSTENRDMGEIRVRNNRIHRKVGEQEIEKTRHNNIVSGERKFGNQNKRSIDERKLNDSMKKSTSRERIMENTRERKVDKNVNRRPAEDRMLHKMLITERNNGEVRQRSILENRAILTKRIWTVRSYESHEKSKDTIQSIRINTNDEIKLKRDFNQGKMVLRERNNGRFFNSLQMRAGYSSVQSANNGQFLQAKGNVDNTRNTQQRSSETSWSEYADFRERNTRRDKQTAQVMKIREIRIVDILERTDRDVGVFQRKRNYFRRNSVEDRMRLLRSIESQKLQESYIHSIREVERIIVDKMEKSRMVTDRIGKRIQSETRNNVRLSNEGRRMHNPKSIEAHKVNANIVTSLLNTERTSSRDNMHKRMITIERNGRGLRGKTRDFEGQSVEDRRMQHLMHSKSHRRRENFVHIRNFEKILSTDRIQTRMLKIDRNGRDFRAKTRDLGKKSLEDRRMQSLMNSESHKQKENLAHITRLTERKISEDRIQERMLRTERNSRRFREKTRDLLRQSLEDSKVQLLKRNQFRKLERNVFHGVRNVESRSIGIKVQELIVAGGRNDEIFRSKVGVRERQSLENVRKQFANNVDSHKTNRERMRSARNFRTPDYTLMAVRKQDGSLMNQRNGRGFRGKLTNLISLDRISRHSHIHNELPLTSHYPKEDTSLRVHILKRVQNNLHFSVSRIIAQKTFVEMKRRNTRRIIKSQRASGESARRINVEHIFATDMPSMDRRRSSCQLRLEEMRVSSNAYQTLVRILQHSLLTSNPVLESNHKILRPTYLVTKDHPLNLEKDPRRASSRNLHADEARLSKQVRVENYDTRQVKFIYRLHVPYVPQIYGALGPFSMPRSNSFEKRLVSSVPVYNSNESDASVEDSWNISGRNLVSLIVNIVLGFVIIVDASDNHLVKFRPFKERVYDAFFLRI